MDHEAARELTAAYALDALDSDDERALEEHLGACDDCREEVTAFAEVATALAYAVETPPPMPALRARILADAREARSNVVPFRRRRAPVVSATVAALSVAAALALAFWARSLDRTLDQERQTVAVLSDPGARHIQLRNRDGALVVSRTGEAALVLAGIRSAPADHTYQVWVLRNGVPTSAGLFEGDDRREVVVLERPVRRGETVAVTVERDGGAAAPTRPPIFAVSV